ncbi:MAG: orotidine-5'-phosphate decarboxylase [Clostridiaceae bacterium]
MIIDKLYKKVEEKGNVCLGLDTSITYIPEEFSKNYETVSDLLFNFNKKIIDETIDAVSCYKVQIAYYEALGIEGLTAYKNTLRYIREKGEIVIADVKRGDIKDTADMYARAHFSGDFEADFITLNPYMGMDSIEPYLTYIKNYEKGIFPLIRTSNQGAYDIEYIKSEEGKRVFNIVAEKINKLGESYLGNCGYSSIGGVVGCTHTGEALEIRKTLKSTFLLIPGYGAQGGGAKDVEPYLNNKNGAVVNSSRGILLAYKKKENEGLSFYHAARSEAIRMRDDLWGI